MLAKLNALIHGAERNRAYLYRLATVLGPVLVGAHFITGGTLSTVLTLVGAVLGVGGTGLAAANTSTKKAASSGLQIAQLATFDAGAHTALQKIAEHIDNAIAGQVVRRRIEETIVAGKRLGRHVEHDVRSLAYQIYASIDSVPVTARWERTTAVLDQGDVGSCTGNAAVGHLGTAPEYPTLTAKIVAGVLRLDEAEALRLYSAAEVVDGGQGYPPEDQGSSGLSVAKAAKAAGLISGYLHMTSLAACHTAIQTGPFIVGTNWYTSMDSPDSSSGVVEVSGSVRGGHEYECIGYSASTDLWEFVNSWGTSYGVAGHFYYTSASLSRLLAEQGDATQFVPLSQPAPVPTPVPVPVPTPVPIPPPSDPTAAFLAAVPAGWENKRHVGDNAKVAKAVQALRTALGLPA